MALITGSDAFATDFTPAAGSFIAQASGSGADLLRANASGASYQLVGRVAGAVIVDNPIAGAVFRWSGANSTVRADQ
jgi:hypothetical protein